MIKRIKYKSRAGNPIDCVLEIVEQEKKFIFAKNSYDEPVLINRKDIIEITDPIIEQIKR